MIGWMVGDVIKTPDEVNGLMQERLYVHSPRSVPPSSAIGCTPIAKRLAGIMPANCSDASTASAPTSN